MKRFLLSIVAYVLLTISVQAATCYWVGGAGNFDNTNTASWSSATGPGGGGTCAATGGIPKNAGDIATFDANSGGGTIVICGASTANCPSGSGSLSIATLEFGAFASGVLDFLTISPNVTLTTRFGCTSAGTVTRRIDMGNGVWTWGGGTSAVWACVNASGLTLNKNGSSIVWVGAATASSFFGGAQSYGPLTINANSSNPGSIYGIEPGNSANNTFASLTINAPAWVQFRAGAIQTFTNGISTSGGSASNPIFINTDNGSTGSSATLSVGATSNMSWASFRQITGSGSTINATNAYSYGGNGGTLSITNPAAGGGGKIIGG